MTAFWSVAWKKADTTRGGIIIPDSAKDKPQEGEVISAGKGKINDEGKTVPLDVKEGDRILFGKYSGTEIKIDGEDFIIMREEEVLGILTGAAPARRNRRVAQVASCRLLSFSKSRASSSSSLPQAEDLGLR